MENREGTPEEILSYLRVQLESIAKRRVPQNIKDLYERMQRLTQEAAPERK